MDRRIPLTPPRTKLCDPSNCWWLLWGFPFELVTHGRRVANSCNCPTPALTRRGQNVPVPACPVAFVAAVGWSALFGSPLALLVRAHLGACPRYSDPHQCRASEFHNLLRTGSNSEAAQDSLPPTSGTTPVVPKCSTIHQVHGERIFREADVANSLVSAECQCAHSRPPESASDAPRSSQLVGGKAKVPCESNGLQPEFCRSVVSVDVNVRWLIRFMAEEVDAIGSAPQERRHSHILPPTLSTAKRCNERRPKAVRVGRHRALQASAAEPPRFDAL